MFTFVGTNADGLPQKRKQTQKACDTCRKHKKRCKHAGSTEANDMAPPLASPDHARGPRGASTHEPPLSNNSAPSDSSPATSLRRTATRDSSSIPGDRQHNQHNQPNLPNAALATPPAQRRSFHEEGSPQFVGDLNPEGMFLAASTPTSPAGAARPDNVGVWLSHRAANTLFGRHASTESPTTDPFRLKLMLPYIEDQCLRVLPAKPDLDKLEKIYFEEVDPIFPVLDRHAYEILEEGSHAKVLLSQAICLAASYSSKSAKSLNLPNLLVSSHKEFVNPTLFAMRVAVSIGQPGDTLVSIQVLALMSLFTQLSNDRHLSTELNARAVSWTHTAGLHLRAHADRKDTRYLNRLFLCVWALDRLNAAFHGRPVLIHERDFGIDLESCFKEQESCFQLFLRNILLLDHVIQLYRPAKQDAPTSSENDFPTFEELLHISGATRVSSNLVATIETLYHAVAMLSYRPQGLLQEPSRNTAPFLRQTLSAAKVTYLVGQEFNGQLSMLPIVPYAISLSLRVCYRDLRLSKVPLLQTRARRQLVATCALLKELGKVYQSALVIADLAEQMIREMDKVFKQMMSAHEPDMPTEPIVHDPGEPERNSEIIGQRRKSYAFGFIDTAPNAATDTTFELAEGSSFNWDPGSFDPSLLDSMPDFDVFEHFNPDFNLEAMDAALIENIHLSFPMQPD